MGRCLFLAVLPMVAFGAPWQATGIKIGEVTDTSAIVWCRLTRDPAPVPADAPMVEIEYERDGQGRGRVFKGVRWPVGRDVSSIRDAVPGAPGEVQVRWRPAPGGTWQSTAWATVAPEADFTRQFTLTGLHPSMRYQLLVESRAGGESGAVTEGSFRTAPRPDRPRRVLFCVTTGTAFPDKDRPDGYRIYPSMRALEPSFFVHTGDILYYDNLAKNEALARYHWQRMYGLATNVAFHREVPSYFIKDDHDSWMDDCWPTRQSRFMGAFTFAQGQRIFLEQVPVQRPTYRTFRWGRDLQIWLPEGRDYRSPNHAPDGPEKTIWGPRQKAWFKASVAASDATFKVVISPTPMVGPDRAEGKNDNHANDSFATEGRELRSWLAAQRNVIVICGDRHWQYVSVDPETGLREYSCGPASDQHAGGFSEKQRQPMHRYLKIRGGFLSATVDREDGAPIMELRHHAPDGSVEFEDLLRVAEGQVISAEHP